MCVAEFCQGVSQEKSWRLYCGSHDNGVYCWNEKLELIWRTELNSEVFSTPFLCDLPVEGLNSSLPESNSEDTNSEVPGPESRSSSTNFDTHKDVSPVSSTCLSCVCVCSTSGIIYILDAAAGIVLGTHKLPSEVFSSPVVLGSHIVVGSRDNCVYSTEVCTFVEGI